MNNTYETTEQFYETLSIFANVKKWSFNLTLRTNNYFKRDPNTTLKDTNFDIFRKSVRFNSKNVKITLGDFYSVLGHGLVLSVQRNDEIFRERTILGGDFQYFGKHYNVRILGGEIKDDTLNQKWNLIGGEASINLSTNTKTGVRFSYIGDVDTLRNLGNRITYSFNLKGNKLLGNISYYAEVAMLTFTESTKDPGTAIYSNLTYNKSHTTIQLEYKNYKDFDNEINNPPVADKEDETSTITDTEAIRILFQYTIFEPEISFFINLGKYREYSENGTHIYGGVSALDLNDKISFNISYGIKNIIYPIKKIYADFTYIFSNNFSINLSVKDKRYEDGSFKFNEQDHSIQLTHSSGVSVFFLYQYSHNRIIGLNNFYNGGITISFKNNLELRLTGGTIRGGQVCSGGQCYTLPPFKGLKFSLLKTFR